MATKGRKQNLKSGDEYDIASPKSRKLLNFSNKFVRYIKRKMNKRERKDGKTKTQQEIDS